MSLGNNFGENVTSVKMQYGGRTPYWKIRNRQ